MKNILSQIRRRKAEDAVQPIGVTSPYPEVELVHWSPKFNARNFGDHLSRIITNCVLAEHQLTLDDEVPVARRILAIGSILHLAQKGDVIWGSGWNGKIDHDQFPADHLDIRAVRGPKTARLLRDRGYTVPEIFGDPALLTKRFFGSRFKVEPTADVILIPNLNDIALTDGASNLVSPLLGWNRVVSAIVASKFVVTSSLHGLVIAEAFGVPARLVKFSDNEPQFKYDDYGQGTGRDHLERVSSVAEALKLGPYPAPVFDEQALLDAFPIDLWREPLPAA